MAIVNTDRLWRDRKQNIPFQLLLRPFEMHTTENFPSSESDFSDIRCIVNGLIDVFVNKIYKLPSSNAIKIHTMLVTFLEKHYSKPKIFENCNIVRKMVNLSFSYFISHFIMYVFFFRFLNVFYEWELTQCTT